MIKLLSLEIKLFPALNFSVVFYTLVFTNIT